MTIAPAPRDYRTLIAAASLAVGPLLMAIGDLFHPEERMDSAEQIAIVVHHAPRWFAAHLLLFVGILTVIPGLLALADLTAKRKPAAGYAGRILVLIGVAGLASVILEEMAIGWLVWNGGAPATAIELHRAIFLPPIAAVVMPAVFLFFAGIAVLAIPLMIAGGRLRIVAVLLSTGGLFVLAEILSAQVILSQIGNVLLFCASSATAWLILRGQT